MPTMSLSYKQFPAGTVLLDAGTVPVTAGAKISLSAFSTFTNSAGSFSFLFWDTEVSIGPSAAVTFTTPSSDFAVDAWYALENGGGAAEVATSAFSRNQHKALPDTPIASVSVAGAWPGPPSTVVSTAVGAGPFAITAVKEIVPYGLFLKWLQFGDATISGEVITAPAKGASTAIAFFGIPEPDPCQTYRNQLAALSPGDFPTMAAYKAAVEALGKELVACEEKYGEIATP